MTSSATKQTVPDKCLKLETTVWRALSVLKSRLQNALQILVILNGHRQKTKSRVTGN